MKYTLNFDINLYVCSNLQRFKSCFKKSYRRALGREDNCNSDEAPQRRRPTTSTRKQREAADVAEDAPHVDHATEEVFKQHKEAVVDDQGFPGRSCDTSVLTAYGDHVAAIVWNGEVFIVLN